MSCEIKEYTVKYAFCDEDKTYQKKFKNPIEALKFQGDIIRKYKNNKNKVLEYCIYE